MFYKITNFFYNIKRLLDYIPIIWRDRDWDEFFLYDLMQFKLGRMLNHFRNHSLVDWQEEDLQALQKCVILLGRLVDSEYYHKMAYTEHEKRWGEIRHTFKEGDRPGYKICNLYWENAKTPEEEEQASRELMDCHNKEYELQDKDLKEVCDLIYKYSRVWWD